MMELKDAKKRPALSKNTNRQFSNHIMKLCIYSAFNNKF